MRRSHALALSLGLLGACSSGDGPSEPDLGRGDGAPLETGADRPGTVEGISPADAPPPGTLVEVTGFGSNPGQLRMFKLVPASLPTPAPLLVVLHGCGLTAATFAEVGGWGGLAVSRKLLLVFAEQSQSNNPEACFNWFLAEQSRREKGEALSIKQMVDRMRADHSVDGERIFVTGLSAGAAMTTNLLAAYPDLFAGGAVMAGVPAGCASSILDAYTCMDGIDRTPAAWGALARALDPGFTGRWPRVVIFHGSADAMVDPMNLQEIVDQWTDLHGTDATADEQTTVKGHTMRAYRDAAGKEVVRAYTLQGMAHGIAVDPGSGPEQGGVPAFNLAYSVGLFSPYYAATFLGL